MKPAYAIPIFIVLVDVEHHPDCPNAPHNRDRDRDRDSGPAKVVDEAYRTGWENIFGQKQPVGEA